MASEEGVIGPSELGWNADFLVELYVKLWCFASEMVVSADRVDVCGLFGVVADVDWEA